MERKPRRIRLLEWRLKKKAEIKVREKKCEGQKQNLQ